MKNFKLKRLLSLAFIGCLGTLSASTVFAAAGVAIDNTATLSFTVGGGPAVILESSPAGNSTTGVTNGAPTSFLEDRVINFTVAEVGGATNSVVAGSLAQVQTFTVTNNGNAPQDFLLAALNRATTTADPWLGVADSFAPANVLVFAETVNAGAYVAADDTAIFIQSLAIGATRTVYIVSDIGAEADGALAVMTLVAQVAEVGAGVETAIANAGAAIVKDDNGHASPGGTFATRVVAAGAVVAAIADDPLVMETVFNDPAGDVNALAAADVIQNGQHSASDSYTVQAASLSIQKTAVTLWDPANGNVSPKAIKGAFVRYSVTITNTGTASGNLTSLGDPLPASLALDPDFIIGSLAPATSPAILTPAAFTANATTAAGESFAITHGGASTRTATSPAVCTGVLAGADGCDITGQTITIDFATIMPVDAGGGTPYLAGELKAGDTVTITFNAIVQ